MKLLYAHKTRVGMFFIGQSPDGRFHPIFDDESLGSYVSPQQAVDDLSGGHTFSPSGGFDTSTLGIPEDVSEWVRVK
jgi:hypothetical protein